MIKSFFERFNRPNHITQDKNYIKTVHAINMMLVISLLVLAALEALIFKRPHKIGIILSLLLVAASTAYANIALTRDVYWANKLFPPLAAYAALTYILMLGGGLRSPATVGYAAIASLIMVSETWYILLLSYISLGIIASSATLGYLPSYPSNATPWVDFAIAAALLTTDSLVFANLKRLILSNYQKVIETAQAQKEANLALQALKNTLEEQVKERTAELQASLNNLSEKSQQEKRRLQLYQSVANIARHIAAQSGQQDSNTLLSQIAKMVADTFNLDHVGIFLIDKDQRYAVLAAASSEGGQKMLTRHHRLAIGQGIVGYVAQHKQERIVRNVGGSNSIHFNNPDLPDTQAEGAFPLLAGENLVGVLDIQSNNQETFTEDAISVLKILSDEIGIAIYNQTLFAELQNHLNELQTIYREQARESWKKLPARLHLSGYRYRPGQLERLPRDTQPMTLSDDKVQIQVNADEQEVSLIAPIQFRGETLAALQIKTAQTRLEEIEAQKETLQVLAERIALAIENARLHEETNRRARREHLVARITTRLRSTNDPEQMLAIARQELKEALSAREIRLVEYKPQDEQAEQTR